MRADLKALNNKLLVGDILSSVDLRLSPFLQWCIKHYMELDGILPKGPYPPCLRMADRTLLAGYPRPV